MSSRDREARLRPSLMLPVTLVFHNINPQFLAEETRRTVAGRTVAGTLCRQAPGARSEVKGSPLDRSTKQAYDVSPLAHSVSDSG
ncbi:hypothetical protein GCM10009561_25240 [Frigoribacterium faeni]